MSSTEIYGHHINLPEPNPGGMVTTFQDKGDHYLLNGAKMWISNAP